MKGEKKRKKAKLKSIKKQLKHGKFNGRRYR